MSLENKISKSYNQLFAYNNVKINTFGKIKLICLDSKRNIKEAIVFEIVDNEFQPILSRDACVQMNLVNRIDIHNISVETKDNFNKKI